MCGIRVWTPVSKYYNAFFFNILHAHQFFPSICPGRFLSDNSLYSIVSCVLAVYDITPPVDEQGNTVKLKPEFTTGLVT